MKFVLPQLKVDQRIWALVEEVVQQQELIVSFQGDLVRVSNQSERRFRPGQRIQLVVASTNPLGFKLMESKRTFGLDINV